MEIGCGSLCFRLWICAFIRGKVHISSLFYKEVLHNCGSVCVFVRGLEFGEDLISSLFRLWICAFFFFLFLFLCVMQSCCSCTMLDRFFLICIKQYNNTYLYLKDASRLLETMLGSKTLGTKYIRTSMCNVLANHDQNLESRFKLFKVCLCIKLESSDCIIYWTKSARLD